MDELRSPVLPASRYSTIRIRTVTDYEIRFSFQSPCSAAVRYLPPSEPGRVAWVSSSGRDCAIAVPRVGVVGQQRGCYSNLVGYQEAAAKRRSFAPMIVSQSMIATSASKTGWV